MLRFLTAGESHGPGLTAIIEGLPAGLTIDENLINDDLARRQQGFGRGRRMAIEKDRAEITAGLRFGVTIGSPLTITVGNKDWPNWREIMAVTGSPAGKPVVAPRPGHADLAGILKYQRDDIRDILERASARETAMRVAVGSIFKQLLSLYKIKIVSQVTNIGGVALNYENDPAIGYDDICRKLKESALGCTDPATEERMKEKIQTAAAAGDTLGGSFNVEVFNALPGLGSHVQWDRRLDSRIAGALMSIPAVKGVEIGEGFNFANLPGSQAHDAIYYDPERGYFRTSNRAGGIEGGISNGETIVAKAAMKPIPTLMKPLASVDIKTHQPLWANTERSDVCAVTAAAVVGEAMMAFVMADELVIKFGGDSAAELTDHIENYKRRLRNK